MFRLHLSRDQMSKNLKKWPTGTRRKASSISSFVSPFLSRKERLYMTGDPLTFGCERNFTAFWTWSSRIGSEFTNTEAGELPIAASGLGS